ncbi:MAG: hypothetical protein QM523_01135 [Candidatus Pacebacteria bacterium]|nr:hypothetical protein [Candidatus Paceibacterota bacterium]
MTDLMKNTTAFGLMGKETQDAMQNCGGPWEIYTTAGWADTREPRWVWYMTYRQKPPALTPDSIDWGAVHKDFICMARYETGSAWLFKDKPRLDRYIWLADQCASADSYASYRRGTVDWKDSLVWRPGYGPEGEK